MTKYLYPGVMNISKDIDSDDDVNIYMNEPSFKISVEPHDELINLFDKFDFTRRGQYTWSLHTAGVNASQRFKNFIREYSQVFMPSSLICGDNPTSLTSVSKFAFFSTYLRNYALNRNGSIIDTRALDTYPLRTASIDVSLREFLNAVLVRDIDPEFKLFDVDTSKLYPRGDSHFFKNIVGLTYEIVNNVVYFRLKVPEFLQDECNEFSTFARTNYSPCVGNINGLIGGNKPHVKKSDFGSLNKTVRVIRDLCGDAIFTDGSLGKFEEWRDFANSALFVGPVPGQPTQARIVSYSGNQTIAKVGRSLTRASEATIKKARAYGTETLKENAPEKLSLNIISALERVNPSKTFCVHPSLLDVKNMSEAKDYKGDNRLYGYQRRAVGLQLSTNRGLVNALDTGLGKSIIQLTAMRERAKHISNYRGLIVVQSNTVNQWKEYAEKGEWFPEAHVCVVNSRKKVDSLRRAIFETVDTPVVIIATFSMASTVMAYLESQEAFAEETVGMNMQESIDYMIENQDKWFTDEARMGEILNMVKWDDICADEAPSIRNGSSVQARAMWALRRNSTCGTALTATPFNKSVDDIARLLAWARNDSAMFYGNQLSTRWDENDIDDSAAREIFEELSPMVFRFTKEEAQEEESSIKIPKELAPITLLLDPSPAEKALSQTCELELKRLISEFEIALDAYEAKTDVEKEELQAARDQLNEAKGHYLSGTNLARMAVGSPSSILKSNSVAAQLVISQGLVNAALKKMPTKQEKLLSHALPKISEGKQILVFTDFVDVAKDIEELFERNGVRAGTFGGNNIKKRDENRIAFQNGELDVLVCTKAAERGLTLHRASVTYHYDLSWTPEPLLQKAGRAVRVGSENEEVETYFLILKDTIEEKVVEKVFARGSMSSLILDNARGVDISKTTTGKLMGGLMSASENINSRKGALAFGKALLGL